MSKISQRAYDTVIAAIQGLLQDERIFTAEALDAVENIRDYVEPWIDALQNDLDTVTARMEEHE